MKKTVLLAVAVIASLSLSAQTELFYTDFATKPANIVDFVGTTLADPTTGTAPDWEIVSAGGSANKLATSTQKPYAAGVTTISETGRLTLGGKASFFTIKQLQGPFSVDVYWGTGTVGRNLVVTLGANEAITTVSAEALTNYKTTCAYDGIDKVDVKIACTASILLYDVLVISIPVPVEPVDPPTSIAKTTKGEAISTSYLDVTGKNVAPTTKGILIKKATYADGSVETNKVIVE